MALCCEGLILGVVAMSVPVGLWVMRIRHLIRWMR